MKKKNFEIRIKVTKEESVKIKAKAEKIGMSMSSLGRFLLLHSSISVIKEA